LKSLAFIDAGATGGPLDTSEQAVIVATQATGATPGETGMRTYVAGHRGMVGSAICAELASTGADLLTCERDRLDLTDQAAVRAFFKRERPERVIIAAARVGGILANDRFPAEFIHTNVMIAANLIAAAHDNGVERLLMLSSSCVYPREAPQPIPESALLTGPLEPTNEAYAIAKIAGMKMCESFNRQFGTDYRTVMPCNLYGPNDNYDVTSGHVVPALMRRLHEARLAGAPELVVWGSGAPRREFLHVRDMANAALFVLGLDRADWRAAVPERCNHVNVGSGSEISIGDLAALIADVVGYRGALTFDRSKPDGTPRKLLDVSLLGRLGWRATIPLRAGLEDTYRLFQKTGGERS